MRPSTRCVIAVLLVCLGAAVPAAAHAQQRPPQTPAKPAPPKPKKPKKPRPPLFLMLGVSGQVTGNTFTQPLTFSLYGETATITGPISMGHAPHFDAGFGVQVNKRFSLGAGVSFYSGTGHLEASYSIPNPLVFNANRTASGGAAAHRSSVDLDFELAAVLASGKAWRLELLGGPTFAWVTQQLATDALPFVEGDYPYETIVLDPSASSAGHSGSGFGIQIGTRLAWQFNRRTSVTMGVRWRHAAVNTEIEGTSQPLKSGGLQIGGGIRFVF